MSLVTHPEVSGFFALFTGAALAPLVSMKKILIAFITLASATTAFADGYPNITKCFHDERALLGHTGPSDQMVVSSFKGEQERLDPNVIKTMAIAASFRRDPQSSFGRMQSGSQNSMPYDVTKTDAFLISPDGVKKVHSSRVFRVSEGETVGFDVNGNCVSADLDTSELSGRESSMNPLRPGKCNRLIGEAQTSEDARADAYPVLLKEQGLLMQSLSIQLLQQQTEHMAYQGPAPIEKNYEQVIDSCVDAFRKDYAPNAQAKKDAVATLESQWASMHLRRNEAQATMSAFIGAPLSTEWHSATSFSLVKEVYDNLAGESPSPQAGAHVIEAK